LGLRNETLYEEISSTDCHHAKGHKYLSHRQYAREVLRILSDRGELNDDGSGRPHVEIETALLDAKA